MATGYNKKIFALLLDRARGERSLKKYAEDCNISYVQLRKLSLGEQENPPRMRLIEKLGAKSENDVTTEDFAFAAGYGRVNGGKNDVFLKKYASLDQKQKREAEAYLDYLLFVSEKNKKSKGDN